jgi:hypothetical protein
MGKVFQTYQKYLRCRNYYVTAVIVILLFLLQFSCAPEPSDITLSGDAALFKTYSQGHASLDQRITGKEITIAEQLKVVLETSAPENMAVEFPVYSASLGDFTLIDVQKHPARMAGTGDAVRVIHGTTYLLEPYLPGTYTIPEMVVTFVDGNNGEELTRLETEEIQIAVKSLLDKNADSLEIKDIKGPLSLPENTAKQIILAGIGLLLILLVAAGFLYWQKISRRNKPIAVQLRPEEIALQELEKLLAEELLSRGEVKLFHLKISDILRHYIENRFGFRAAERTTEEFLTELSLEKPHGDSLLGNHKTLLAHFLSQCDLVKFAKHEPTIAESEKTVSLCRKFIEQTREETVRSEE